MQTALQVTFSYRFQSRFQSRFWMIPQSLAQSSYLIGGIYRAQTTFSRNQLASLLIFSLIFSTKPFTKHLFADITQREPNHLN